MKDIGKAIMYGVPEDLPLDSFVGTECNMIGLGRFLIQFHFYGGRRSIDVESNWDLRDANGILVDQAMSPTQRKEYRVHAILDQNVRGFTINAPVSFTLQFENGYTLTIYGDDAQYECFALHTDGHSYYV